MLGHEGVIEIEIEIGAEIGVGMGIAIGGEEVAETEIEIEIEDLDMMIGEGIMIMGEIEMVVEGEIEVVTEEEEGVEGAATEVQVEEILMEISITINDHHSEVMIRHSFHLKTGPRGEHESGGRDQRFIVI
jgi:hypothetical protein